MSPALARGLPQRWVEGPLALAAELDDEALPVARVVGPGSTRMQDHQDAAVLRTPYVHYSVEHENS